MKKLIALLMVIAMVACLFAGCGETDKQGSDAPAGGENGGTTQSDNNGGGSGEADYSKSKGWYAARTTPSPTAAGTRPWQSPSTAAKKSWV